MTGRQTSAFSSCTLMSLSSEKLLTGWNRFPSGPLRDGNWSGSFPGLMFLDRRGEIGVSGKFSITAGLWKVHMITLHQTIDRLPPATVSRLQSFRVLVAFSIVASIVIGFNFSLSVLPITPGLDQSFVYAFNYAAAKHLSWGREFISTYGPYGYLVLTMDVGELVKSKIAFSFLHAVASGTAVAAYLQSVPGLRAGAWVGLTIALIYALNLQYGEYRWFGLFLLVLLIGLHERRGRSLSAYAIAGLLAGFYLLIKFSLGFGAIVTLVLGSLLIQRPLMAAYRLAVAVPAVVIGFLVGWIAHGGAISGIGAYLSTGWEVSSGYSSAMSLAPRGWQIGAISFTIWFALIAVWVVVQRTPRNLLTLAGLVFPLFIAWKHSMVRQDSHVGFLFSFGIFVIAILLAEAVPSWRWRRTLPIAVVLVIPLAIPWFNAETGGPNAVGFLKDYLADRFVFPGLNDLARLSRYTAYRDGLAQASEYALRKQVLPESMRAVIGRSSVDVYPWETSYVPANELFWVNRPVPASFTTYTPALDGLNAAFFKSNGRPKYLIWHTDVGVNSIDGRYLFWDEPRTLRAIVNYYDMVAADAGIFLLRAREHPRFALPELLGTQSVEWNTWTPVPQTTGVILTEASMTRPLIMRFIRTIFREGPVLLSLRFNSGEEARYRVVPENMGGGLWISPVAVTLDELRSLFQGGPGRRVVAVRFSGGLISRLSPPITVSWFQLMRFSEPDSAVHPYPRLSRLPGQPAHPTESN